MRPPLAVERDRSIGAFVGFLVGIDLIMNGISFYTPATIMARVWMAVGLVAVLAGARIEIYKRRRERMRAA